MSSTLARQGITQASTLRREEAKEAELRRVEAARFVESPVWTETVGDLRANYLNALLNCPEKENQLRYQLQMALKVFDTVENHIVLAHNRAGFSAKKAIKADFGKKSWFR